MEAEEPAKSPISVVSCVLLILLLAAALGIGTSFMLHRLHDQRAAEAFAAQIEVHRGARPADPKPDALENALPKLDSAEGLRFLARPTFSLDDYGVAIHARPDGTAEGAILVYARIPKTVTSRAFTLPAPAWHDLTAAINSALAQEELKPRYCTDGVAYTIERAATGRRSWGTNGVACPLRYARVAAILRAALAKDAPGPDLPTSDTWSKPG